MRHLFFLLLFVSCCAHATPLRRIASFSSASGLGNAYVMAMAEDASGLLWAGTERGLWLLDGYGARAPYYKDPLAGAALQRACVSRLLYDRRRGLLWVGTRFTGLFALRVQTGEVLAFPAVAVKNVTGLALAAGRLWVADREGTGLWSLDVETGQARAVSRSQTAWPSQQLGEIAADRHGVLYIASYNRGLLRYNPATGEVYAYREADGLPSDYVRSVLVRRTGAVVVGTYRGVAQLDVRTGHCATLVRDVDAMAVAEDKGGCLWAGTENEGVVVIEGVGRRAQGVGAGADEGAGAAQASRTIRLLPTPTAPAPTPYSLRAVSTAPAPTPYALLSTPSLSNKTVKSLFVDSRGHVCAGTYGDGVDVFSHRAALFSTYTAQSGAVRLTRREVMAVAASHATGCLWVGMDGAGIDVLCPDGSKCNYNPQNSALRDGAVLSACRAADGSLWFGTYGGQLLRVAPGGDRLEDTGIHELGDIRQISRVDATHVAVAAVNGFALIDTRTMQARFVTRKQRNLRNFHVRCVSADARGRIWAGTEGHGIDIYDAALGFVAHLGADAGQLPSDFINDMALAPDGRMVVATNEGAVLTGGGGLLPAGNKRAPGQVLLPDTVVRSALFADGRLWLATCDRLLQYDIKTGGVRDFTFVADAVAGDFSPRCAAVMADGTLAFGSHLGLATFSPRRVPDIRLPAVRFVGLQGVGEAGGRQVYTLYNVAAPVRLAHDAATFTVAFTVADPEYCGKAEYAYQLAGGAGQDRWYAVGRQHELTFHNLPPGRYTLRLRARLPNGSWGTACSELQVRVLPPWWWSWWAITIYTLLALCAALTLAYYTRRRIYYRGQLRLERQARRQEKELIEERMRFFTNITHELRTPLSLIIGPVDDLLGDNSIKDAAHRKLQMVQQNAQRLLAKINTILEFRKTETQNKQLCVRHGDMRRLVSETALRYRESNTRQELSIECQIADGQYEMVFDPEAVSTVLDNLMSNACKYTRAGTVRIQLAHEGEWTVVRVSDTGMGIAKDALPHVFERYYQAHHDPNITSTGIGLALTAGLVKLHEGTITAESTLGKGSTFTFCLRTDNVYPDANHSRDVARTLEQVYAPEMMDGDQSGDQRPVVLVVEDNDEIRQYIKDSLAQDFLVHTAADGQQGLQKARELVPDIVVTDVMMPVMDGMEMARRLKADVATSHIPLIILTAKAGVEDRTEAYTLGAESFIPKPFTARLLRSRMLNILEQRRRIAAALAGGCNLQSQDASKQLAGAEPLQTTATASCSPQSRQEVLANALSQLDREFVEKIDAIIDENIKNDNLDVNFLAARVAMSYSTLYRKMKAVTGLPVNQYVRKRRIRRAEGLLLTARYTVSEVAFMVGINSMSNFRQLFKEEFGVAPSEYAKRLKAES